MRPQWSLSLPGQGKASVSADPQDTAPQQLVNRRGITLSLELYNLPLNIPRDK
jgi:hypothetical protein